MDEERRAGDLPLVVRRSHLALAACQVVQLCGVEAGPGEARDPWSPPDRSKAGCGCRLCQRTLSASGGAMDGESGASARGDLSALLEALVRVPDAEMAVAWERRLSPGEPHRPLRNPA